MAMDTSPQWAILKTFSNEPLKKQKKMMKTKNMIWAALSMKAALVMTACSSDDNTVETPAAQQAVKTIPYSVTVSQSGSKRVRACLAF